jgi:hypothetical protein
LCTFIIISCKVLANSVLVLSNPPNNRRDVR